MTKTYCLRPIGAHALKAYKGTTYPTLRAARGARLGLGQQCFDDSRFEIWTCEIELIDGLGVVRELEFVE